MLLLCCIFPNITELDISGMVSIDRIDFVECISFVSIVLSLHSIISWQFVSNCLNAGGCLFCDVKVLTSLRHIV